MKKIILALIILILPSLAKSETTPFTIERSEVLIFSSENNEREYQLFVKTPRSYTKEQNKNYPVIFLNDGNYSFPLVSSITRQMSFGGVIEEPIIIGISYDKKTSWQISRTRDYTPTKSINEKNSHSDEALKHSGGASDYLLLIENELMPFLRKQYRIDSNKEIYAGHSFGGLFGGYILKTKPQVFDYYILSDPSFWYHEKSIFNIRQSGETLTKANVLIVSQGNANKTDCISCMAKNAKEFSEDLKKNLPVSTIEYLELKNDVHETVFPSAMSQGLLRFLRK